MQPRKKPSNENLCVPKSICDFINTCTYLGAFYKTQKKAFKVLRYVTYMGPFFLQTKRDKRIYTEPYTGTRRVKR